MGTARKPKTKKKAKKKKKSVKTTTKAKKGKTTKVEVQKKKNMTGPVPPNYSPGSYSQERLRFIRAMVDAKKASFREASAMWKDSVERASLLEGMSHSEKVRRRFVQPQKAQAKAKVKNSKA